MLRIGYRVATCGLSLALIVAATVGAAAQAVPAKPAPAAKPAAPPPPRPAPPAAPRVAAPPPAARVAPPVVRQAPVARPVAPVIRQAPVAGPAGPPHPSFQQRQAPVAGPGTPPGPAFRQHQAPVAGPAAPPHPTFQQRQAPVAGPGTPPGPAFRQHQAPVAGPASPSAPALQQQGVAPRVIPPSGAPSVGSVPASAPTNQQGAAPRNFGATQQQNQTGRTFSRHPGMPGTGAAGATANVQSGVSAFGPGSRGAGPGLRAANRGAGTNRVLRNQVFTNPALIGRGSTLANTTFRGRFAANRANFSGRHHFNRGRVLGWYGQVFWPYAYYDMFDYAFWPYAYDTFWPYAYDDLYNGMFGPYAYGYGNGPGPGYDPGAGPAGGPDNGADREATGSVGVCSNQASSLTNWPIEKIAEAVQPTPAQTGALDQLTRATGRAVDILKAACPTKLPSTPTGRLAALQSRLEAMVRAVDTVGPALNAFYQSLSDEQRARFDAMGQERDADAAAEPQGDLAQVCSDRGTGVALPLDRIAQDVRPNDGQRAALDNLANSSQRAAELLKANCPTETALTPTGRIDAMKQRLTTMLNAVQTVRPALEAFYNSLDYEQRARFNVIGAQEG